MTEFGPPTVDFIIEMAKKIWVAVTEFSRETENLHSR